MDVDFKNVCVRLPRMYLEALSRIALVSKINGDNLSLVIRKAIEIASESLSLSVWNEYGVFCLKGLKEKHESLTIIANQGSGAA